MDRYWRLFVVLLALALLAAFALNPLYAQAGEVNTYLYIKSAKFYVKKVVTDPVTGKVSKVTVSSHSTMELAQRAAWKLPEADYVIAVPDYYLRVRPCAVGPGSPITYCNDFVDSRISVVSARTTNRIMFVTPMPPGTAIPP